MAIFGASGWIDFGYHNDILAWAKYASQVAKPILENQKMRDKWLQCQGTWFVGVDVLPNDPKGNFEECPFPQILDEFMDNFPICELHAGQLSVLYPGYPKPRKGDTEASFAYRKNRDAAHVDGLIAKGSQKKRFLLEPHGVIFGIPLNTCGPKFSPLVIWEGSHHIMQKAFERAFSGYSPNEWSQIDITQIYKSARKICFETCKRIEIYRPIGYAYALHPLTLHGISAWQEGCSNRNAQLRMVAYFRPQLRNVEDWLKIN